MILDSNSVFIDVENSYEKRLIHLLDAQRNVAKVYKNIFQPKFRRCSRVESD